MVVIKVLHPLVAGGIDAFHLRSEWTIIGVFYVYLLCRYFYVTDIQKLTWANHHTTIYQMQESI